MSSIRTSRHMDMMWDTSSRIPAAVAIQVFRNWNRARTFMATVENDYGDDPILMASLSMRYYKLKQWDNAERCAKKRIVTAADYGAYRNLAAIYKEKGDLVHWKETLVKSLDLPSAGLEQAQVQNEIAQYHMNRKEWSEAVVFADAAAVSYSAWSMMTASRCHEMLGQWEKAEAFIRAVAERYDGEQFEWMKWCHRTGHGDAEAADNLRGRISNRWGRISKGSSVSRSPFTTRCEKNRRRRRRSSRCASTRTTRPTTPCMRP